MSRPPRPDERREHSMSARIVADVAVVGLGAMGAAALY
jgi:hypothetical protein